MESRERLPMWFERFSELIDRTWVGAAVEGRRRILENTDPQHIDVERVRQFFGVRYSFCDTYLAVFYLWANHFEFPVQTLPRYASIARQVLARPAFQRALLQQGLNPGASRV